MAHSEKEMEVKPIPAGKYPGETIAVAFARTSRIPGSIQDSLDALSAADAQRFHERWVVGYGHSSVAEHAIVQLAVEGVSRLAVDRLQQRRLASYTEKSTRYQEIGPTDYVTPESVLALPILRDYEEAHHRLFDAYAAGLLAVDRVLKEMLPQDAEETDKIYQGRIRSKNIDINRYLLPKSVRAVLGVTMNAREMEYACSVMLSDQLPEVRLLGTRMAEASRTIAPTLLKYVTQIPYVMDTESGLRIFTGKILTPREAEAERMFGTRPQVELVNFDPQGEDKFLAACLFRSAAGYSLKECLDAVGHMTGGQRAELIKEALGGIGDHDRPIRELELPRLLFDLLIDWAAYYDFKRNRMETNLVQDTGWANGAVLPGIMEKAGVAGQMMEAIGFAKDVSVEMRTGVGAEGKYLETNATLQRMGIDMDLRQAYEFFRNRASIRANPGYRYAALLMGELAQKAYPGLWKYLGERFGNPPAEEVGKDFFGDK